jgi:uncharacterized protein YjeT (DUF2065 family)
VACELVLVGEGLFELLFAAGWHRTCTDPGYVGATDPGDRVRPRHRVPSPDAGGDPMRILGILLVVLGIVALAVPSITFMTTERAVDAGFFTIDVQKPHTIVLNPIAGIVAVIAGVAMLFAGRRTEAV